MFTFPLTAVVEDVTRTQSVTSALVGVVSTEVVAAPGQLVPIVAVTPDGALLTVAVIRCASFLPADVSSSTSVVSAVAPVTRLTVTPPGAVAV
jgi:hypothetical protein